MDYLYNDIQSFKSRFKDIYSNAVTISKNTANMANSLNHLESIIESGFYGLQSGLSEVSQQLDDMFDLMVDFRNMQFIQNEERNQFLSSIDATLKAPNKTAANEKYEISLELASKNKHDIAIKFLKEAIELNPLHYRSYIQLTLNLLKTKNYEEAVHYAKESINFAPDDHEVLAYTFALVAHTYEKIKSYNDALPYINQAIHYGELAYGEQVDSNEQANYIYAKARYYALLHDAHHAMIYLEEAILEDYKYFSISLMDSAFQPLEKEREKLLTSMKKEIEAKLNDAMLQIDALHFHQYNYSRLSDDLQYIGFDNSIIEYRYKDLHPNFKAYKLIYIAGVERGSVSYSYNSLVEEFNQHYAKLHELNNVHLPVIKKLRDLNTFEYFHKAYNEYLYFKMKFNDLVNRLTRFVQQFSKATTIVQKIFNDNHQLALENSTKTKNRLNQEKRKKFLIPLGVVGALIFPIRMQHDHRAEHCLQVLYERTKKVVSEAQHNVDNEEKHTLAIQGFVDEVLKHKLLPNVLR